MSVCIIADIVASRALPDRARAQEALEATIARVEASALPFEVPLRASVGDELQGIAPDLGIALVEALLLRLALPAEIDCRFGIGLGATTSVPSRAGALSEGPGWWAARGAIEHLEQLQRPGPGGVTEARAWVAAAEGERALDELARAANAGLLARDRIVGRWSERTRRVVFARLTGSTQQQIADAEQISQSAVSQALAGGGATAVMRGALELAAGRGSLTM